MGAAAATGLQCVLGVALETILVWLVQGPEAPVAATGWNVLGRGETVSASLGQPVVFSCNVDAKRGQTVLGWRVEPRTDTTRVMGADTGRGPNGNSLAVEGEPGRMIRTNSAYLVLEEVSASDAGRYTCYYELDWRDNFYHGLYEWPLNALLPFREARFNFECLFSARRRCLSRQTFELCVLEPSLSPASNLSSGLGARGQCRVWPLQACSFGGRDTHQQSYVLGQHHRMPPARRSWARTVLPPLVVLVANKWLLVILILSGQLLIVFMALTYYIVSDAQALYRYLRKQATTATNRHAHWTGATST